MKTLKLIAITLLGALAFSCSDEDKQEFQDDLTNSLETEFLKSDDISNGITIEGATFVKENPPTPTGDISFSGDARKGDDDTAQFIIETEEEIDGVYQGKRIKKRNFSTINK